MLRGTHTGGAWPGGKQPNHPDGALLLPHQWYDVFAELFEPVTADRPELVRKGARRAAIQSPAHSDPAAHVRASWRRRASRTRTRSLRRWLSRSRTRRPNVVSL